MDMNALNGIEERFFVKLQLSYTVFAAVGSTTKGKTKILHGWIRTELKNILGDEYTIMSESEDKNDSKEKKVEGKYYGKDVDICVSRGDVIIGVISVKFINASFIKNANNYIESQMGETANLRSNNIVFAHLLCITEPIPKYKKDANDDKIKICDDIESIRNYDIKKYHTLVNECPKPPHAPDVQGICIANSNVIVGQDRREAIISDLVTDEDLAQVIPPLTLANRNIILTQMDIKTFFTNFVQKVEAKYLELQQANQQNQP